MPESPAELLAKRIILGIIGGLIVGAAALSGAVWLFSGDPEAIRFAALWLGGASLGPLLLPRWKRWPALRPGNRVGAFFLGTEVPPGLLFLAARIPHPEDTLILVVPLAVGWTALWWSVSGWRLDRPAPRPASRPAAKP